MTLAYLIFCGLLFSVVHFVALGIILSGDLLLSIACFPAIILVWILTTLAHTRYTIARAVTGIQDWRALLETVPEIEARSRPVEAEADQAPEPKPEPYKQEDLFDQETDQGAPESSPEPEPGPKPGDLVPIEYKRQADVPRRARIKYQCGCIGRYWDDPDLCAIHNVKNDGKIYKLITEESEQ